MTECFLQIGADHLIGVIKDREERLFERLVKMRLLGEEPSDDEDILRLGSDKHVMC